MSFAHLIDRTPAVPWSHGGKIPWHEPGFSERMLREHLSQEHDRASRRLEVIDRHVAWLHETVGVGRAGRVLDLGCGPGLYTERLAQRGHTCVGIDFSPASIAHAHARAESESLACEYRHADLRHADYGAGFDLVLLTFGELNTFPEDDARTILAGARRALAPEGRLVLEVHTEAAVRRIGASPPVWRTARNSVFSDRPHLWLRECAWHEPERAATERYFVAEPPATDVATYVCTTQAYADDEYRAMLRDAGFTRVSIHASLAGAHAASESGLVVSVARASTAVDL
ncbi:MAG: class I SAM-dependent methyltransferase [Planctomycetota bacterium]|nr:class I SAM-dependent methyltransferase [Planctomycetota bacterium]